MTIFAFDEGQGLSEHAALFDVLVQVHEAEAETCIAGNPHGLHCGEMILMPAGQAHALKALVWFKMILTLIAFKHLNYRSQSTRTMNIKNLKVSFAALALLAAAFATTRIAQAHCDSLEGPVVNAARAALTESNVNLVLIWVQPDDESAILHAFEKTLAVRLLNADARELADMYFFETLVRVHRAGEGAPYTGLKPAGTDFGPAIPASDTALATGDVEPVLKLLSEKTEHGIRQHFLETLAKKTFDKNNIQAGREFVKAYVEYTHYVKGIHDAAAHETHGHFPETAPTSAAAHSHKE